MKIISKNPKDVEPIKQNNNENKISKSLIKKIKEIEISKKNVEILEKEETQNLIKNKGLLK